MRIFKCIPIECSNQFPLDRSDRRNEIIASVVTSKKKTLDTIYQNDIFILEEILIEVNLMNAVVIYSSRTGYTEKYAMWIAEELSAKAYPLKDINNLHELLDGRDLIIYGGGLYASGIDGLKDFLQRAEGVDKKPLILFSTGLSIPSTEVRQSVMSHNLEGAAKEIHEFFYFRGGFNYESLGLKDRILMRLLKMKIEIRKLRGIPLNADEKGMLAVFNRKVDFTSKSAIRDLLSWVSEFKLPEKASS